MAAIAVSVGDWYFDREKVKEIDCPYPCDNTCHNLVFNNEDSSPIPNLMVYESKSTRLTTFIPQNLSSLASMTPLICFHCIILLCGQGFRMSKSMLLSYGLALILFSYNFLQSRA
ncbi:hypothetical protein G4B88_030860 [Cannabis sativa]|uniref:Pectin acetylesterase n=1 Tax=Cannabis sativa TaxID=3483 RepID=A0A7J6FM10_CANSA|nr:hypothetical protein G4B88_030860 [Cannabis sativa]